MTGTIGNKQLRSIVIAVTGVLVIVGLSIWQFQRVQDTGAIIKHTNQVLSQTQEVLNTAVQYELNVKNFLLTGDSSFLDSAGRSRDLLPGKIDTLKNLTLDNKIQLGHIDSLSYYAGRNRVVLERAMELSRSGDFEGAARLIVLEATTGTAHRIQSVIGQSAAEERALLDQRRRTNQQTASELQWVLWTLIAAVTILVTVTLWNVRIDLSEEKRARLQLSRFNQELERQVESQTASLRSSEEKYKTLFYNSPLPKWIYDQETFRFLEVNDTAIRNYGYNREEFLTMTIRDIRPEEDQPRLVKDVEEVRLNPGTYKDSRWRHTKKNGEVIDVDITAHAIDYDGRPARMVVASDITERKRYEMQLQQLNVDLSRRAAELAASNAELERFAYIASHDLQEPLRMVSSFLQLLQKRYGGQLDSKADQYIHYAVDGAERMKALILDLLEYSRVGTGKEGFGWVNTSEVMGEVGEVFREKIITAHAQVEIGLLPSLWGDRVQLTQLLQNLVGNALKYHSDRPLSIRISCREEAGAWLFSVEDNGIGIDPQFFDKIFIIFQRLHNKSDYSGTGIGLAICKKIVERHGGRIWVESAPQQGSAFYFTIAKKPL